MKSSVAKHAIAKPSLVQFSQSVGASALLLASAALWFCALALPTQAATFTVQFTGVVNSLTTESGNDRSGPPETTSVTELSTLNTLQSVQLADQLIGQYRFDDTTNEITTARFRFVSAGSGISLNPSEASPVDILFEPVVPVIIPPNTPPTFPIITSFSQANQSSARYELRSTTADTFGGNRFSLSDAGTFSYLEGISRRGGSFNNVLIAGNISSLIATENIPTPPPQEPSNPTTDVPEPPAAVGLLLLTALGYSLRRQ